MSKRKHGRSALESRLASPRQLGLTAFRQHNYTEALRHWTKLEPKNDPAVRVALAEAYFHRALASRLHLANCLADLRRAIELLPDEARFWYHLGLTLHRTDQLEDARAAYARATDLGLQRRGCGFVRGLAEIETALRTGQDASPRRLGALPWLSVEDHAALTPIAALVGGTPEVILSAASNGWLERLKAWGRTDPSAALWERLARLATGDAATALTQLTLPRGQQLRADAERVCVFYRGLAAAANGDTQAALNEWTEAARASAKGNQPLLPRLSQGLAALHAGTPNLDG